MYLLDIYEGKSKYELVDTKGRHKRIPELEHFIPGEFEVKELLSGDYLLIGIRNQEMKIAPINSIASSLIRQTVYGCCLLLNTEEAAFAALDGKKVD